MDGAAIVIRTPKPCGNGLFFFLLWAACIFGGSGCSVARAAEQDLPLRPTGSPDVVIMGFAGNIGGFPPTNFSGLRYLTGMSLLADAFHALGKTVEERDYASRFHEDFNIITWRPEAGLNEAIEDLVWIHDHWMVGFANPTRIVMVGNSWGGMFAHLTALAVPEVQIDYMVDADTMCALFPELYIPFMVYARIFGLDISLMRQRLSHVQMPTVAGVPIACPISPWRQTATNTVPYNIVYNLDTRTSILTTQLGVYVGLMQFGLSRNLLINLPLMTGSAVGIVRNRRPDLRLGPEVGIYRFIDPTAFHAAYGAENAGARWVAGKVIEMGLPEIGKTFEGVKCSKCLIGRRPGAEQRQQLRQKDDAMPMFSEAIYATVPARQLEQLVHQLGWEAGYKRWVEEYEAQHEAE